MDKSFVNIDNLVRQRLSGGEEQERSGSWEKMNALLDKEMPQERPLGGFGWRRFFGAVAVLLCVGTAGVGGYKLVMSGSNTDAGGTQGTEAVAIPAGSSEAPNGVSSPGMEHPLNGTNTGNNSVAAVRENTPIGSNGNNLAAPADATGSNAYRSNTNTNTAGADVTTAGRNVSNNAPDAVNNTAAGSNRIANGTDGNRSRTATNRNTTGSYNNTNTVLPAGEDAAATSHVNNNHRNGTNVPAVAGNNTARGSSSGTGTNGAENKAGNVSMHKMAVGSTAPGGKTIVPGVGNNTGAIKTGDVVSGTTATSADNKEAPASNVPVFITNSGKRIPGDKLRKMNIDKAKQNEHTQNTAADMVPKTKRVIQKMAIVERSVKTIHGTSVYKLDTISVTTLTEEMGIITETKVIPPPAKKTQGEMDADSKDKGMMTNSRARKHSRLFHGASMSNYNAEKAEAASNKRKTGAVTLENISAAFNDVKYRMSCARFTGGITGGINTAFFGPSSLMGFQFGLLGDITISEKVSVSGELKYFNRINGNNAVNDNYYTYTPMAGGGYSKELQMNSYSFASVHSFEMPVAVRFTQGKLNLFAGGNLSYSVGVSTGAETTADPNSRTVVSTVANDNAPQISYKDFGSRLGVGYLFGASYQVSPHVTLDIRNVQTVWDNSKTSGARAVSNQLYRNPSLQFSVGYRFGGKKRD